MNKQYFIVTCRGVVEKCQGYKTAIIDNSEIISTRKIKAQCNCFAKHKSSQNSRANYYTASSRYHSNEIKNFCWLRIRFADTKMSSRLCSMGNDPNAYAEELIYARKIVKKYFSKIRERVAINGHLIKQIDSSDLDDCEIKNWRITARH